MGAARRSARHQPMHEGIQAGDVVGLMLDADNQPVGVRLGRLDAPFIAQLAPAISIDRLTGFEQFNDLVDAFRGAFPHVDCVIRGRLAKRNTLPIHPVAQWMFAVRQRQRRAPVAVGSVDAEDHLQSPAGVASA